ncbi:hypothetical protein LTR70_006134 [Exophiala xenobiotica]|nr:hypothetical protein LTR70_006134 [Exophiala xenobiotica]
MAESSYLSSPTDELSPYYPQRYIRPLPKRSIRSRLSVEAAGSISYPPNPPSASLPAYSHYGEDESRLQEDKKLTTYQDYEHEHDSYHDEDDHDHDCPHSHHHHHHHCHHHDEEEDDLDSVDDASPIAQRHSNPHRASPRSPRSQRHGRYHSYSGKSSSAPDGYEAFENTNNKKKRKIPTSGSLSIRQTSLNSDFSQMGVSSRDGSTDDVSQAYDHSPSGGIGVSGAGRSRSARKSNSRNPLGVSVNGSNVRAGSAKYDQSGVANVNGEGSKADQGIISKAIANATTLLRNPLGKGQENVGVLDQQAKTTPTNSQFTFTCESDAKGVKFPEQSLYSPDYAHRVNSAPAAAPSQTSKYNNNQATQYAGVGSQQAPPPQQPATNPPPQQKQRPRRRKGDVYALAARQRKLQQEYSNLQHPPSHEDIWICEFCEYESIFGSPPHALVRQYEIKDRRERKRLAEKRRLLEKAKLKGRKGKKQSKNAAKAANTAAQQPLNNPNYDQQPLDQMDDYLDEGYDEDPIPMPDPQPQAPAKQAMPGSYDRGGGTGRTSTGSAGVAGGGAEGGAIR